MSRPTGCSSQSGVWWVCKGPDRTGVEKVHEERSQSSPWHIATCGHRSEGVSRKAGGNRASGDYTLPSMHRHLPSHYSFARPASSMAASRLDAVLYLKSISLVSSSLGIHNCLSHRQSSRKQIIEGHEFRAPHGAIKMHFSFSQGSKNPWCSATNPLSLIPQFH